MLASCEGNSNRIVDVENVIEKQLDHLHQFYAWLSAFAAKENYLPALVNNN